MTDLLKPLFWIIAWTLAFPPLFVGSFVLFWSAFSGGDYLWGSAFLDFLAGTLAGFGGVLAFTRLRQTTKNI